MSATIKKHNCLRCGFEWYPRSTKRPTVCPECKSPYYDKPKGEKTRS